MTIACRSKRAPPMVGGGEQTWGGDWIDGCESGNGRASGSDGVGNGGVHNSGLDDM